MKKEGAVVAAAMVAGAIGADQETSHAENFNQAPPAITSTVELPPQQYPELDGFKVEGIGEEKQVQESVPISMDSLQPTTTSSQPELPILNEDSQSTSSAAEDQSSLSQNQESEENNESSSIEQEENVDVRFIEGDVFADKEAYKQLVVKGFASQEELNNELKKLQGENAEGVNFDPEKQVAFLLALEGDQPLFEFKGVEDKPGETDINFNFATAETDGSQYDPESRSNYFVGILDKSEEYKKIEVNISHLSQHPETPFITSTIDELNKPTFKVPVAEVANGELEKCFGESMTEISALMKQYNASGVEFYPAADGTGYYYVLISQNGEKFAWNGFAADSSYKDEVSKDISGEDASSEVSSEGETTYSVRVPEVAAEPRLEADIIFENGGLVSEDGLFNITIYANDKNDGAFMSKMLLNGKEVDLRDMTFISGVTNENGNQEEYLGVGYSLSTPLVRGENIVDVTIKNSKGEEITRQEKLTVDSEFTYFEKSDTIANPEDYKDPVRKVITTNEEFEKIFRDLYGEEAQLPSFNPDTQTAFFAGHISEDGKPTIKVDRVKRWKDYMLRVNISNATVDDSKELYMEVGRSNFVLGILDENSSNVDVTVGTVRPTPDDVSAPWR